MTRRLASVALGMTLLLVAFGGYTRGSGSGYGCEDSWPLCKNGLLGGLLPRLEFHMIVEWTHRWIAAMVGLMILALAVAAWRRRREAPLAAKLSIAAVAVVGLQAWIGRLVVANDLDADLVSVHLGISMAIVALVTAVAVLVGHEDRVPADRSWGLMVAGAAVGSIVILLLGSYVHNLYVSGWPLVGNRIIPDLSHRLIVVHFAHRVVAPLLLGYLVFLSIRAQRHRPRLEAQALWFATGLFVVNIALGGAHVLTRVESSLVVALHLLVAAAVWTVTVAVAVAVLADRRLTATV